MVRWYNEKEHLASDEFRLTLRMVHTEYPTALTVSSRDTLKDLKTFMGVYLERYPDEMTLQVNLAYPYPLSEEMTMGELLVEHRDLMLRVHEGGNGGREVTGRKDADCEWWAQPVPLRYLLKTDEDRHILDLRYLPSSDISRIRAWLYQIQRMPVTEIWLLGTHPRVQEMLSSVAEDVLCLRGLVRVWIQNPEADKYQVPPLSVGRHDALWKEQAGEWRTSITRDALVYLYQHLVLDRYRDAAEDVSIVVDRGLVSGWEGGRWRP